MISTLGRAAMSSRQTASGTVIAVPVSALIPADVERQDMLERQVSVALEGGHEDNLERAFDSELQRIIQFYHKKVRLCGRNLVKGCASVELLGLS